MSLFGRAKPETRAVRDDSIVGQRVELMIRGLGRTSGKVMHLDEEYVIVSLVVNAGPQATTLDDPDAILEYSTGRGLMKRRGKVRFDVKGTEAVRFVPSEEPQHVQRRDFVRVEAILPVTVRLKDGVPWDYDTVNISANGVLLARPSRGLRPLKTGMFVSVSIPLDDGRGYIDARGTVVREAGGDMRGVRFDHIAESHQERLARFVARLEREKRRRMGEL